MMVKEPGRQRSTKFPFTAESAEMTKQLNRITQTVIGAAIAVHREFGPGLPESACEACLAYEPAERGLAVEQQEALPVKYRGVHRLVVGLQE